MNDAPVIRGSLRRGLMIQLLIAFLILATVLYISTRLIAVRAADSSQDSILSASAASIAQQARLVEGEPSVDIPYAAFDMLGVSGQDRVFYRIGLEDGELLSGYDDLPTPEKTPSGESAVFRTAVYRGDEVRVATRARSVFGDIGPVKVIVSVAQTRETRNAIVEEAATAAGALGVGFLILASSLSLLAVQRALKPLRAIEQALAARGPHELQALRTPTPREVAPLVQTLNGFLRRLRAAFNTAENFIAEAAHRVRTPLAGVRAQAEFALASAKDPQDRRKLRDMIRAIDEAARATGQILDHAMVAYRADRLEREPADLRTLAEAVCEDARPGASIRDIDLEFEPGAAPAQIACDPILVTEALRNLVDNALKYSPADSRVCISVAVGAGQASVRVADQGGGFPTTDAAALIQRFRRGENAGNVVGSGLGLTIVDEVARAHGGALKLSNRAEGGACAEFSLPLLEDAA